MNQHLTVLITTYQGERHVAEQMESVLAQTRPPELVVVADDGSTDGTLEIVQGFQRTSRVPIRVLTRSQNAGLRVNVETGLRACSPGAIVLADQDDVWAPDKLANVDRAFSNPSLVLWFSDADLIDVDGRPLGRRAWEAVRFDAAAQEAVRYGRGMDRLLHGMTVTGATMAFRSELLRWALPLPPEIDSAEHIFLHDGWLAVLGCLVGEVHCEPRALVQYRQHPAQVTAMAILGGGGHARSDRTPQDQLRTDQVRARLVADRLRTAGVPPDGPPGVALDLFRRERFLTDRLSVWDESRAVPRDAVRAVRNLLTGNYHRYARGTRTVAKDLTQALLMPVRR